MYAIRCLPHKRCLFFAAYAAGHGCARRKAIGPRGFGLACAAFGAGILAARHAHGAGCTCRLEAADLRLAGVDVGDKPAILGASHSTTAEVELALGEESAQLVHRCGPDLVAIDVVPRTVGLAGACH